MQKQIEEIESLIEQYLAKPDKRKVHRIDIVIPGYNCMIWIAYAGVIILDPGISDSSLLIYFSFNPHSKKNKRISQTFVDHNLFEGYTVLKDGKNIRYHKETNNDKSSIAFEVMGKVSLIFPASDIENIRVTIHRLDNWMEIN
jgi:hypothetical protein